MLVTFQFCVMNFCHHHCNYHHAPRCALHNVWWIVFQVNSNVNKNITGVMLGIVTMSSFRQLSKVPYHTTSFLIDINGSYFWLRYVYNIQSVKEVKSTAFKISFYAIKRGLPNILLHIMLFTPLFATRHFLYVHVTSFVNSKLNHRIEIHSLEYKMLTVNFIYSFLYYYQISMHATILSRIYFKIFSVCDKTVSPYCT